MTFKERVCRFFPPILSYRLATRVFMRAAREAPPHTFVTRTITGALFTLQSGDLLGDQLRMCGFWDWRAQAIAKFFCRPGDSIVEVGANTGTETVGFAQIVLPAGKVYAFEPLPELANAIRRNAAINGFTHIETLEAAVTDEIGMVRIELPTSAKNSGQGHISSDADAAGIEVPALTLDSYMTKLEKVSLVAIDVEGYELSVFRGAEAFLRRDEPVLVVEAVAEQLERAGSSIVELHDALKLLGYESFEIRRISVNSVNLNSVDAGYHKNWLCLPKSNLARVRALNAFLRRCAFSPGPFQPLRLM